MVKRIRRRLVNLLPDFLKPLVEPVSRTMRSSRVYRNLFRRPKSREDLHRYWRRPTDGLNRPEDYLEGEERSQFLLDLVRRHAPAEASVLEIGCGVGRNLNHLYRNGFHNLEAVEISERAVRLLHQSFPEMALQAEIHNAPIEDMIRDFSDGRFDVTFTMAVLEHIHSNSEWVFPEIARITRDTLITIEDEETLWWRHFPRNYKNVFESLGMREVEVIGCEEVSGLGRSFLARVFKKG